MSHMRASACNIKENARRRRRVEAEARWKCTLSVPLLTQVGIGT